MKLHPIQVIVTLCIVYFYKTTGNSDGGLEIARLENTEKLTNPGIKDWFEQRDSYLLELVKNKDFPVITNFGSVISALTSKKCFTVIDNIRQIDLPTLGENPVMLRSIVPLVVKITYGHGHSNTRIFHGPISLAHRNLTTQEFYYKCPFSNFYIHASSHVFCVRLNIDKYWRKAIPWNCQVQIGLFPMIFYNKIYGIILQHYTDHYTLRVRVFPYLSPNIQIFVPNPGHKQCSSTTGPPMWIAEMVKHQATYLCRDNCKDIYMYFCTSFAQDVHTRLSTLLPTRQAEIDHMRLLKMCKKSDTDEVTYLDLHPTRWTRFARIIKRALLQTQLNPIWKFRPIHGDSVIRLMAEKMQSCDGSELQLSFQQTPIERVSHAWSHTWLSIIGNYTILHELDNKKDYCSKTIIV